MKRPVRLSVFALLFFLTALLPLQAQQLNKTLINDIKVNDDSGDAPQSYLALDMHPYGPLTGAWFDQRNDRNNIFAQRYSSRGFPSGTNFRVNQPAGTALPYAPDVAVDGRGHFYIVWTDNRNDDNDIYMQVYKANGEAIGENIRVNDDNTPEAQIRPAVAADNQGRVVVCWEDSRLGSDKRLVYAQFFDPDRNRKGDNFIVDSDTTHGQLYPAVDMNREGSCIITWTEHSGGNHNDVFCRRYNDSGEPREAAIQISNCDDLNGTSQHPTIAYADNYDFAVFWEFIDAVGNIYVHGQLFNKELEKEGELVRFEDTLGYTMHTKPAICTVSYFMYSLAWQANKSGELDILGTKFETWDPEPYHTAVINDRPGMQIYPAVTNDYRLNYLYGWHDNRDGDFNIYAAREGKNYCNQMTFAGGYNGQVVISWEPPYGYDRDIAYRIYKSTDAFAEPELLTVVDPSERAFPNLMFNYIDTSVVNGRDYYYEVVPAIDDPPRHSFLWGPATPSAMGHILTSSWMQTVPDLDGHIDPEEWQDATSINIQSEDAGLPITLYVKNDDKLLYLALDDRNNRFLDDLDYFGLMFDENNNQKWDSKNGILEGALYIDQQGENLTTYMGTWPETIGIHSMTAMQGIEKAMSLQSGNLQYEVAISLLTAPLMAQPGNIIGARFFNNDPENYYKEHYHHASEWPAGSLWETPRTLGQLQLATESSTPHYNWPMVSGNIWGQNIAAHETELMPPFEYHRDYDIAKSEHLAILDNTMIVAQAGDADSENAIICYDLEENAELWTFTISNTSYSVLHTPAISDSLVFCRGQGNDSLFALDRFDGTVVWRKHVGRLTGDPVIEEDRLYLAGDTLYSIRQHNGEVLWRFDNPGWDKITTPTLDDNFIYLATDEQIFCLDKTTGALEWQKANKDGSSQSLLDRTNLYTFHDQAVVARDKSDGSIKWSYPLPGSRLAGTWKNCMVLMDNILTVPLEDDGSGRAGLVSLNALNGTFLWEHKFDTLGVYTPSAANNIIYVVQRGRRADTGFRSKLWAFRLSNGEPVFFDTSKQYFMQPVIAGHNLWVHSRSALRAFSMQPTLVNAPPKPEHPTTFQLLQNYPNPFNPRTTIRYNLDKSMHIRLDIYSLLGEKIRTLVNDFQSAGNYQVTWDATNPAGVHQPSGVYFIRLQSGDRLETRKMLLIK